MALMADQHETGEFDLSNRPAGIVAGKRPLATH